MRFHIRQTHTTKAAKLRLLIATTALAFTLGACSDNVSVHGNLLQEDDVEQIAVGLDDRNSVANRLGTPSTLSTFQDDTWYYMGSRVEKVAFMKPQVLERRVVVVRFDDTGAVEDKSLYTLEDGRVVDLVSRKTPTEGRELTILQQFFGNLGRFSGESGSGN